MATFGRVRLTTAHKLSSRKFEDLMDYFTLIGFLGLIVLIPFFVLPFSFIGSIIVGIIEGIGVYFYLRQDN